jgi:hypothetical protein
MFRNVCCKCGVKLPKGYSGNLCGLCSAIIISRNVERSARIGHEMGQISDETLKLTEDIAAELEKRRKEKAK